MNRLLDRLLRRIIKRGSLRVVWYGGVISTYGDGGAPSAELVIKDPKAARAILRNPELGLGETYMEGQIDFPDRSLPAFLTLINKNWRELHADRWVKVLARARYVVQRAQRNNDRIRARRNVSHHYDLDERLYRLFLDTDMQYSCAYFERPGASLEEAQLAKKRHIAAKLAIKPGHDVLDIGSGWGGLGLYLAETSDARVTGVTLSTEQHRVSNERARQRGLDERVRFELQDYRHLTRTFDRIVSVGMFEHVGAARYDEYFGNVARLLKDDGIMLLHSIGRFGPRGSTNPWIAKYIFPGGYIPAISEVMPAIEKAGLIVTDMEILRLHYAETLKAWRERFVARWDEAAALYDERFCRMWNFYLAGSEAAFRSGGMMNFQIQIAKNQNVLPLTRDYIHDAEQELSARGAGRESLRIAGG